MGKVGLIPCGRYHRRWCRGRRRCCLRSLWCLWFPCTSPEKKRLLPHMLKILKPVLQRRKWQRQGGEASWWPPGSVSQTGPRSSILYTLAPLWIRHLHMRKTEKSVSRTSFLLSLPSWLKCAGLVTPEYMNHMSYESVRGLFHPFKEILSDWAVSDTHLTLISIEPI